MAIRQIRHFGIAMNLAWDFINAMEFTLAHPERGVAAAFSMGGL
jgi:hypothetical protein